MVDGTDVYKRMVVFLYLLMRDHMEIGAVNSLLKAVLVSRESVFSDGILLAKAESVAQQFVSGQYTGREIDVQWDTGSGEVEIPSNVCRLIEEQGGELAQWFNGYQSATLGSGFGGPPAPSLIPLDIPSDAVVKVADQDETDNAKSGGNEE